MISGQRRGKDHACLNVSLLQTGKIPTGVKQVTEVATVTPRLILQMKGNAMNHTVTFFRGSTAPLLTAEVKEDRLERLGGREKVLLL